MVIDARMNTLDAVKRSAWLAANLFISRLFLISFHFGVIFQVRIYSPLSETLFLISKDFNFYENPSVFSSLLRSNRTFVLLGST